MSTGQLGVRARSLAAATAAAATVALSALAE